MKLRSRLLLLPLIAVGPTVALLAWNQADLNQARYHEVGQQVLALAKQEASEVDRIGEGALQFLVALAQVPEIIYGTPACENLLERIRTNYVSYLALIRADLKGNVTCSSIGPGPNIEDRLYFRRALETKTFSVGEYVHGRGTQASTIHFAYPIRSDDVNVTGVIAAALDLAWFANRLKEKLPPDTVLNVADARGTILVRIPDNEKFMGRTIPEHLHSIIYASKPGVADVVGLDATRQVFGYVPIPSSSYGFHVGVARELGPAFVDIHRTQLRGAFLIVAGLLGSLALGWVWGEYGIRRPLNKVLTNAQRWREGDYRPSGYRWSRSEVGEVGQAFDVLVSAVSEREDRLRASEQRLSNHHRYLATVLDKVPAGIVQTLPDKTYGFVNQAFCDLLGRTRQEIVGHKFTEFTPPEDWDRDSKLFETAMDEGKPYVHRKRYLRPDGSIASAENSVTQLEDGTGMLAVSLDMSERLKTEEMQQRLINELNHRVKNTLATVQALITMSSRYSGSTEQLVESFVSRLKALSTTHNLLTQGLWEKTALSDLVTAELEPYAGGRVTKIRGPDVSLTPYQAIGLGMVFHELATNAAKYGGLSHQNGSVVVEWSVDAKIQVLAINWEELGNTRINAPQTRGFGSRLIEQSIADLGGNIERDFRETGLVCKINVPVQSNRSPPQFEGLNSTIQVGM